MTLEESMVDKLVTLKYPFINHDMEIKIEKELENYLTSIDKDHLFSSLNYILKELAGNANKANMKRVHFNFYDLDINNSGDYEKGMQSFREDLMNNYNKYLSIAERMGYFVRLDFYVSKGFLFLSTSNNTKILTIEKDRFFDKIKNTIKFKSFEEVFEKGLDPQESAGFGIILSVMMLRKIGLDERYIKLTENEKFTQTKILIPLNLLNEKERVEIAKEIIDEIYEIPQFPQHIIELERILNDMNTNFSHISHIIKKDPSLIADLLKIANSAFYMLPKKVNSIEEAVRLIGFKGVRNLILSYAAQKILMNKYNLDVIKDIMDHSYEVAYYGYEIARKLKLNAIMDEVYLGGILHDFGKIIVNSLKPGILDKIQDIAMKKGISSNVIENLTSGYNHSLIGGELAKKWNFPDHLIEAILFHHIPVEAKEDNNDLVYIVYLANILYYYKRNRFVFEHISHHVLNKFKLNNKISFENFIKPILNNFNASSKVFARANR